MVVTFAIDRRVSLRHTHWVWRYVSHRQIVTSARCQPTESSGSQRQREAPQYIAGLCRRDGCTGVRRITGGNTPAADVTGCLPDGRKTVVRCVRECGDRTVDPRRIRTFHDTDHAQLGAEVTILVVLGPLTQHEHRIALAVA